MKQRKTQTHALVALLLAAFGCTGLASEPGDADEGATRVPAEQTPAGTPEGTRGPVPGTAPVMSAGPMPMRRLTRVEYNLTVRDLLGLEGDHAGDFPADGQGASGFTSPGLVQPLDLSRIIAAAERIGVQITPKIGTGTNPVLPCPVTTSGSAEDACIRRFSSTFGKRAWRRPLTSVEVDEVVALHASLRKNGYTLSEATGIAIEAMLSSPYFLYRWELGAQPARAESDGTVRLTPYEVASRLSYALWSTMPDAGLFAAADADQLQTAAQIETQARRMLADPRAKAAVESFHTQWLGVTGLVGVSKDLNVFPEWNTTLKVAMDRELRAFVNHVVLQGDGSVNTLLTASFSFLNEPLAKLYGVSMVKGSELQKTDLPPAQRFGFLTQPGLLAVKANAYDPSLILRGVLVREQLMCQHLPAPPGDVPPPPPRDPNLTNRQFFLQQHEKEPSCASCHALIDHIGFAFEGYDAIGKVRAIDHGQPIETAGTVTNLDGTTHPVKGPRDLAQLLAGSDEVRRCVASQWESFVLARARSPEDQPSLATAEAAYAKAGFNLRELLVALTTSRTFLFRKPAEGEVTQ